MTTNDIAFVLLTGLSAIAAIKVLDYLNISDPFITFMVLVGILFVVINSWKHVKL